MQAYNPSDTSCTDEVCGKNQLVNSAMKLKPTNISYNVSHHRENTIINRPSTNSTTGLRNTQVQRSVRRYGHCSMHTAIKTPKLTPGPPGLPSSKKYFKNNGKLAGDPLSKDIYPLNGPNVKTNTCILYHRTKDSLKQERTGRSN